MKKITIAKPDDFHIHLRDELMLEVTVKHAAHNFARVLVMPNLNPPIFTVADALGYRERILLALTKNNQPHQENSTPENFNPLMSLYLSSNTSKEEVDKVANNSSILGFKLYPANVTTHSQFGITNIQEIYPIFERMEKKGIPLMLHGESPELDIDIFDREKVFIEKILTNLVKTFPQLTITLEHISTIEAVDFISSSPKNIKASITPHHLLLNRNHLLSGGIKPHYYCMPIVKRREHQEKIIEVVLSGNENFFLGTDSAPHPINLKETSCGCAGIYTASIAIPLCTEFFEQHNQLDKLENFTSVFGARHYGLEINQNKITIIKKNQKIAEKYSFTNNLIQPILPFRSNEIISWMIL